MVMSKKSTAESQVEEDHHFNVLGLWAESDFLECLN